MKQKVTILDTTLRDGEQSLQASLNVKDKLKIALTLENLGIDIIEVGFPISSPGEFKATKTIAQNIKTSQICGLARCLNKDIDAVAEALKTAKNFRIHIFIATSTLHIKYKLKKNFKQIIEMIQNAIKYARKYTDNIQFSCEDAGRTNIEKLYIVVENAIKAGAYTINIPDTVGYTTPTQFSNIITSLYNNVPNIDKAIISVHCHNDLGMAVGNSITAIEAGARQIEGTINGIGERAGNTALEEVIMAIKTRNDILNVYTNIKHKKIYPTCQIVSKICNIPIPYNKAITGSNAFAHSSGIHQDGIIKNRKNYEIINPKSIGLKKTKFNLTSRSGRAAIKKQMQEIGYKENDYDINELYKRFLTLADKKGQIFEYELEKLAFLNTKKEKIHDFSLKDFIVTSNYKKDTKTTITLLRNKKIYEHTLNGNCPLETINKILINITKLPIKLNNYQLIIKNNNKKTIKQTNMIIEYKKRTFHGTGSSKNIIESFIKAILQTINNILYTKNLSQKIKKQDTGI